MSQRASMVIEKVSEVFKEVLIAATKVLMIHK